MVDNFKNSNCGRNPNFISKLSELLCGLEYRIESMFLTDQVLYTQVQENCNKILVNILKIKPSCSINDIYIESLRIANELMNFATKREANALASLICFTCFWVNDNISIDKKARQNFFVELSNVHRINNINKHNKGLEFECLASHFFHGNDKKIIELFENMNEMNSVNFDKLIVFISICEIVQALKPNQEIKFIAKMDLFKEKIIKFLEINKISF